MPDDLKRFPGAPVTRLMPSVPDLRGHEGASWLLSGISLLSLLSVAAVWATFIGEWAGWLTWYGFAVLTALTAFTILTMSGHFRATMMSDLTSRISPILASVALGGCVSIVVVAVLRLSQPDFGDLSLLFVVLTVAGLVAHLIGVGLIRHLWLRGRLRSSALVYGFDELTQEMAIEIGLRPEYGVDVVGFIADVEPAAGQLLAPTFGSDSDLRELAGQTGADRLIIGPGAAAADRRALRMARNAAVIDIPVFVVPRFFEMGLGMGALALDRVRGYPLARLQRSAHPRLSILFKRLFDVSVAGIMLLATFPLLVVVALLVKATSHGPVLFRQTRVGQHGRPIVIRKFRSMTMSESSDCEWTAESRVTFLGKWLRRLNIDEIPQLYSVLVGDMSLVGPRPERPIFVETFSQDVLDYDDRHRMPVGITGLAQIVGLRGDTSIAERVKYDNLYIDQWSFRSDLQILAKTVTAVLRQASDADRVIELERALNAACSPRSSSTSPVVIDLAEAETIHQRARAAS